MTTTAKLNQLIVEHIYEDPRLDAIFKAWSADVRQGYQAIWWAGNTKTSVQRWVEINAHDKKCSKEWQHICVAALEVFGKLDLIHQMATEA